MELAIITVTVAQLFDLGTFVRMIAGHGPEAETNPIVRYLLLDHGMPTLIVAKIVVLSLVVAVVAELAGRSSQVEHRSTVAAVVAVAIVAGLVGGWSNASVLL
ncbi:MAG: hypothetical protein E6J90_36820 [Deltaproteobacteria bacterium]|nr:MAG: hypothetical protein E6J90_36820 [Deltaproteobacteria bacterium]